MLAKGLWIQSSEAVFGFWLAPCVDWMLGGCSIEVLFYDAMHTAACSNVLAYRCAHTVRSSLQVGLCSAWVAMLKCGDSLPMANIVQLTIGVTPSLSPCDCVLVDSFVGP